MRIACPSCAVAYEVPDERLKPGRLVRCARCGHEWVPARPEASDRDSELPGSGEYQDLPETHAEISRPSAMDLLALSSTPLPPDRRLRAAWVISVAVLALLLGSAALWRGAVITSWPASERLYGWAGLQPPDPATRTAEAGPARH
jgi:predicted Zn finger-like uncharacterized protein